MTADDKTEPLWKRALVPIVFITGMFVISRLAAYLTWPSDFNHSMTLDIYGHLMSGWQIEAAEFFAGAMRRIS